MFDKKLINRDIYLNKLISFKDTEYIKIISGHRRVGKSSLLKLMINYLKENNISDNQIIEINFESLQYRQMDYSSFYNYIKEHIVPNKRMYLFFDEIQLLDRWEYAINSFRVDFNCDIYLTGSNAYLLSSEYSTYLSGRCVEVKMLPLSFREFLDFYEYNYKVSNESLESNIKKYIILKDHQIKASLDVFKSYLLFGGMPGIVKSNLDQEKAFMILDSIYTSVIEKDILLRQKRSNLKDATDPILLKKIVLFLADNIGSNVSSLSIANSLVSQNLLVKDSKKPSTHTVQNYILHLKDSYFFYEIKRFDIKGKEYLKTLGKYYIVDIGFRNLLLGIKNRDTGFILENIVYLELLRRGYDVSIGKIDNLEVDFIATNTFKKVYIQVTTSLLDEKTRERELASLKKIKDNYEKIILTLDDGLNTDFEGIKVVSLIDWLLN